MKPPASDPQPSKPQLGTFDAACIIIGIIIGATIFETPPLINSLTGSPWIAMGLWAFAGVLVFVGALCYAELATAYPRLGGDYNYLTRAYGPLPGYLFGWAQLAVVQTASIGLMAFVFANYTETLSTHPRLGWQFDGFALHWELAGYTFDLTLGPAACYAAGIIAAVTLLNLLGVVLGKLAQNLLTVIKVLGLLAIIVVGFVFAAPPETESFGGNVVMRSEKALEVKGADGSPRTFALSKGTRAPDKLNEGDPVTVYTKKGAANTDPAVRVMSAPSFNLALIAFPMVLIMLAYGGWNDAAFVAAEVRNRDRNLPRALLWGTLGVVAIYLLVNGAYIYGLGFEQASATRQPAADVLRLVPDAEIRDYAVAAITILVMISALGAINGLIYTSSRIYSTLGSDYSLFAPLGRWSKTFGTPVWSLLLQMLICLAMVLSVGSPEGRDTLGSAMGFFGFDAGEPARWRDSGFEPLLRCSAPIFWTFFLMTGLSLFVLRINEPSVERPFRVPLYPIVPLIFCASCGYMLYSSLGYARALGLFGFLLVLSGIPFYVFSRHRYTASTEPDAAKPTPTHEAW